MKVFGVPRSSYDSSSIRGTGNGASSSSNNNTSHAIAVTPSDRGLGCRVCGGLRFRDVGEQRAHFQSEAHRRCIRQKGGTHGEVKVSGSSASASHARVYDARGHVLERRETASESATSSDDVDEYDDSDNDNSDTDDDNSDTDDDNTNSVDMDDTSSALSTTSPLVRVGDWLIRRAVLLPNPFDPDAASRGHAEAAALSLGQLHCEHALAAAYPLWTVLMMSGGRFAGAVFDNRRCVVASATATTSSPTSISSPTPFVSKATATAACIAHKTFHRYTTRKKQGGAQSTRDNKQGGGKASSVGAMLRRENEKLMGEDVQRLMRSWQDYVARSSRVFVHAPGQRNRAVVFGTEALARGI